MTPWVENMYYMRKLIGMARIWVGDDLLLQLPPIPPLQDIKSWEIVAEDDDLQILCHPCLPHPRDFLLYDKTYTPATDNNLYVEKARFQYKFQGTVETFNVVLTRSASIIPKLVRPMYLPAEKRRSKQSSTSPAICSSYQESWRQGRTAPRKWTKNKGLSKIMKETRKKKKMTARSKFSDSTRYDQFAPQNDDDDDEDNYWGYYDYDDDCYSSEYYYQSDIYYYD